MTVTLHAAVCILTKVTRSLLLRMRNISDKRCTENQNMYSMFNNVFPKVVPFVR